MARHLARVADARGIITALPQVMASYARREHVSIQTGWTDLGRLVDRGLVRQVAAAAPGRPARYRLSVPAAIIPPDLPAGLARIIRREGPGESRPAAARQRPAPDQAAPCGELDTSPFTREGSPPSPQRPGPAQPRRAAGHRARGISSEERGRAASVLTRCVASWRAQRGPGRLPGPAELAALEPLTALALRHMPPSELAELLTERVASARDLPALLTWRLGRTLRAARRRTAVPADETSARYAAMLAARTGNSIPRGPAAAELARLRARLGPGRIPGRWHDYAAIAREQAAASRAARHATA
jgi:hypothetical protein